jgi:hypothetical protein
MITGDGIDLPSWIQAASAVITVLVTVAVAWYAKRSADTADKALAAAIEAVNEGRKAGKAAQDSAAAAQESTRISSIHFAREWEPHVEALNVVFGGPSISSLNVLNLGMKDAILRSIRMRRENEEPDKAFVFPLHILAPAGQVVVVPLGQSFNVYYQRTITPSGQQQQIVLLICISFDASGADPRKTSWKRYRVVFAMNGFNSAEEVPME